VQIFKPLGLYINYSKPAEKPEENINIRVMMINDEYKDLNGDLDLMIKSASGNIVAYETMKFNIESLGAMTYNFEVTTPENPGKYWIEAKSLSTDGRETTISRRKMTIE
jgi:hypothetical protein